MCACDAPIEIEERTDVHDLADADSYRLDIYLLSEWAGNILPTKEEINFTFVRGNESCKYNLGDTNHSCIDAYLDTKTLNAESPADNLKIYPYGYKTNSELFLNCLVNSTESQAPDNGENTGNDENSDDGENAGENENPGKGDSSEDNSDDNNKTPSPAIPQAPEGSPNFSYTCTVNTSGSEGLDAVWNIHYKSAQNTPVLKIGSGDNFGVSTPISREFNDMPTIQVLNKLGFNVDTFGNHNFDNGLKYLQDVLNVADFSFTISNLYNVPNNLERISPYFIYKVPAVKDDGSIDKTKKELSVAIVGLLDTDAATTISRGVFGTLNVTDYCQTINALEEAYNKNARAFILLPHITNMQNSAEEIFATLFSTVAPLNIEINKKNSFTCTDKLIVTRNMVDQYCEDHKKSCKTDDEISRTVKEIKKNMHQEILNSILFLFGPSNDSPLLAKVTQEKLLDVNSGNMTDPNDSNDSNVSSLSEAIKKTTLSQKVDEETSKDVRFNALTPIQYGILPYAIDNIELESEESDSETALWITEIPSDKYTAKASFIITKTKAGDLHPLYHGYRPELQNFELSPIITFSDDKEDSAQDDTNTIKNCTDFIKGMDALPETCHNFYKDLLEENDITARDTISFDECQNDLLPDNQNESSDNNKFLKTTDLADLQKLWQCFFNAKTWYKTNDGYNSAICSFNNYTIEPEEKGTRRSISTIVSNLFTDAILKHLQKESVLCDKKEPDSRCHYKYSFDAPDILIFNAGTVMQSDAIKEISKGELLSLFPRDYDNYAKMVRLSTFEIARLLEFGINTTVSGAFPAIAGIQFSYHLDNNKSDGCVNCKNNESILSKGEINLLKNTTFMKKINQNGEMKIIDEIFNVNDEQKYDSIYYLSQDKMNVIDCIAPKDSDKGNNNCGDENVNALNECIMNIKQDGVCLIGKYTQKGNGVYEAIINKQTIEYDNKNFEKNVNTDKPERNIKVVITNYMSGGGDNFNFFLNETNLDMFKDKNFFDKNNKILRLRDMLALFFERTDTNDNACHFEFSDDKKIDVNELLKQNLIKRIYPYNDTDDNILCVKTQDKLAKDLQAYLKDSFCLEFYNQ